MIMSEVGLNLPNSDTEQSNKKRKIVRELNKLAFGKRVAELRASTTEGITQERMAEILHISLSYVQKMEEGKRVPSPELLAAMADLLNVKPSHLMAILADLPEQSQDNAFEIFLDKVKSATIELINKRIQAMPKQEPHFTHPQGEDLFKSLEGSIGDGEEEINPEKPGYKINPPGTKPVDKQEPKPVTKPPKDNNAD